MYVGTQGQGPNKWVTGLLGSITSSLVGNDGLECMCRILGNNLSFGEYMWTSPSQLSASVACMVAG